MSSQWMPFALYGINRFVTHGIDVRALAGGTAALVMQNWSCGYYLLYFAPFVPLFVVHRMWTWHLRTVRTWVGLMAAAAGTLVLTLPFLFPVSSGTAAVWLRAPVRRGRPVLRQRLVVHHRVRELAAVGQGAALLPAWGRRNIPGFCAVAARRRRLLLALVRAGILRRSDSVPSVPPWLTYVSPRFSSLAVVTQLIGRTERRPVWRLRVLGSISARTPQRLLMQFASRSRCCSPCHRARASKPRG